MKRHLLMLMLAAATVSASAQFERTPAFPGAEGHGRFVTGGRGGKIVHVTNLNDSGAGSFREAVSGADPKIVVFDVAGVIPLTRDLTIGDNTTILGQTAPYPGVTLRYYTIQPSSNNVIRYIRSRRGQEKDVNDGADAIWQRHKTGLILDHCSFSWSIDEVASFYDNNNFTMQWCTIGESLVNPGHSKGAHGYGGIWGGKLASFHHNLILHVANRSPRFNGARYNWTGYTSNQLYSQYRWQNAVQAENVDFRNCVIYNCGNGCYGGPGGGKVNIVNNYYKSGPAATTSNITTVTVGASGNAEGYPIYWTMTSRYFIQGNQVNTTKDKDWNGVTYDNGTYTIGGYRCSPDPNHYNGEDVTYYKNSSGVDCVRIKLEEQGPAGYVTTHTAETSFDKVLEFAGASKDRDDVDLRYAEETLSGTALYKGSVTGKGGRIDLVSDVEGYTEATFPTGKHPVGYDSDNDGIPDAWEIANGLDPHNADDALLYTLDPKGWYTNLEVYANSLVEEQVKLSRDDSESTFEEYYPTYVDAATGQTVNAGSADKTYDGEPGTGGAGYVTVATGRVTWSLSSGTGREDGAVSADLAGYVGSTAMAYGSHLSPGARTYGDIPFTNFSSSTRDASAQPENAVTFSLSTADDVLFLPDSVLFLALRDGTDGTALDATFASDAFVQGLASGAKPSRNNAEPPYSAYAFKLASQPAAGAQTLTINLYEIQSGKKMALAQVAITGDIVKKDDTGIESLGSDTYALRTALYDLSGRPASPGARGILIEVQTLPDGSRQVRKVWR